MQSYGNPSPERSVNKLLPMTKACNSKRTGRGFGEDLEKNRRLSLTYLFHYNYSIYILKENPD